MKKQNIKNTKLKILIGIFTLALLFLVLFLGCKYPNTNCFANSIVALTGLFLSFISIFLSYKGLMVTNEVKEDIGLQQFKIKQQEEMGEMVRLLNTIVFELRLESRLPNKQCYMVNAHVNLLGVTKLLNDMKFDANIFDHIPISCAGPHPLYPLYSHIGNAYLPQGISENISTLFDESEKIECNAISGSYAVMFERHEPDEYYDYTRDTSRKMGYDWETILYKANMLIESIQYWYDSKLNVKEVNLMPYVRINSIHPKSK